MDRTANRARLATALTFFVTGAVFATWATRIPAVQQRLGLTAGDLALAFAALNAGAVVGLPAGGALTGRLGSRRALAVGFATFPPALVAVAAAPGLTPLLVALVAMAAGNSVVDVAMNAQGVEVERRLGRPVLSGLHAGHSFGVLAGGFAGTAAAAAGIAVTVHAVLVSTAALAVVLPATRRLLAERRPAPESESRARRGAGLAGIGTRRVAALGAVAFLAFLVEGAANDWSAVHLRSERGAGPALAAAGFTVFALALALGRLAGDWVLARWGRRRVVTASGAVAAVGAAVVVVVADARVELAGWGLVGAGVAVVAPAMIGAAASVPGVPVARGVAAVSGFGYLGSFAGPPAIGALASAGGLTAALWLAVAAAALVALLGHAVLGPAQPAPRAEPVRAA